MQANHNKPKTTQTSQTTRKSPSQICVSSKKNSKPDTQKGQEPKQKHPQKRICQGTQRSDHAQKHAKMNYPPRHSVKHGNRNIVHAFVSIEVKNCIWSRAYKIPAAAHESAEMVGRFFSVQRLLAFARSFHMFSCMLHRT